MLPQLDFEKIRPIVEIALREDLGTEGDITTNRIIPSDLECTGVIIAKAPGVIAGLPVIESVFRMIDNRLATKRVVAEGSFVSVEQEVFFVTGTARGILSAERLCLNFMSHLSGIATLTKQFVDKVKDCNVIILDTRKTMPGIRLLEKYAVAVGGGENHRMGLYDQILIKDNHLKIQKELGPDYVHKSVAFAKKGGSQKVEVEVQSMEEAREAVSAGADMLLLDNMSVLDMKEIVRQFKGRVSLEASGGVTLNTVEEIAKTGVDYISIGALTHSAPSLDLSLEIK